MEDIPAIFVTNYKKIKTRFNVLKDKFDDFQLVRFGCSVVEMTQSIKATSCMKTLLKPVAKLALLSDNSHLIY